MATKKKLLQVSGGAGGWDISRLTFTGTGKIQRFSTTDQDSYPKDVYLKPDGTKMYVVGRTNSIVIEYDLDTAWDIRGATYSQEYDFSAQIATSTDKLGLYFKPDGTSMYILSAQDVIYQYDLSTAWDVTTSTYNSANFDTSSFDLQAAGIQFKSDGTRMYFTGSQFDRVYQVDINTAWDLSSFISNGGNESIVTQTAYPFDVFIGDSGTKMYVAGGASSSGGNTIYQYSLGTAWDVTTSTFVQSNNINSLTNLIYGLDFKSDGTELYIMNSVDTVVKLVLSTAWDISTASPVFPTNTSVASQAVNAYGLEFKGDGTKMYIASTSGIFGYDLSTAWDVTTASYSSEFLDVSAYDTAPMSIFINPDGTKMYITGFVSDQVNEFDLSTAWDISSGSYLQSLDISAQSTYSSGIFFDPDGTKMYVTDYSEDEVNQYNLSTAWDITSASHYYTLSLTSFTPMELYFKDDGLVVFFVDTANESILEYRLSTAWDISTASYFQSASIYDQSSASQALHFNDDGTKLFVLDNTIDGILTYEL